MIFELFETHFHLGCGNTLKYVVKEAIDKCIKYFVCIGTNYKDSLNCLDQSANLKNCWVSVGIHPHYACNGIQLKNHIYEFNKLILNNKDKIVSIGEIGLDYFYESQDRQKQYCTVENFLDLSKKHKLPVIIHCRDKVGKEDSYKDCYSIIKNFIKDNKLNIVLHCYTGNIYWLEKFIELGVYIGLTGIITFKKISSSFFNMIQLIPIDRLLLETDAPYLSPEPHRGKINHPKYLFEIANKLSKILNIDLNHLAHLTTNNAIRFYNINLKCQYK